MADRPVLVVRGEIHPAISRNTAGTAIFTKVDLFILFFFLLRLSDKCKNRRVRKCGRRTNTPPGPASATERPTERNREMHFAYYSITFPRFQTGADENEAKGTEK